MIVLKFAADRRFNNTPVISFHLKFLPSFCLFFLQLSLHHFPNFGSVVVKVKGVRFPRNKPNFGTPFR